jgi:hypothetical protein
MLRTLRAFTWMRWRVLMNSLERTGARDTLERLSLAVEQIGPLIAIFAIVPSALALAGLGGYAGYWVGRGEPSLIFDALSVLLLVASGLAILAPLVMPALERTSAIRLLLLPIPRGTLYLAQAATALSEPWVLLTIPVVIGIALGLAFGGAVAAAAVALVAGVFFTLVLVHLTIVSALLLNLVVRDRRRGELLALIFAIVLPTIGLIPGIIDAGRHRGARTPDQTESGSPESSGSSGSTWTQTFVRYVYPVLPSGQFARATRSAAGSDDMLTGASANARGSVVVPTLGLVAWAFGLHAVGLIAFGKLLDSPNAGTRRQVSASAMAWNRRLPGLSAPATVVALAQLRLALRTPRGRSIILSPMIVFAMFAIMMTRSSGSSEFAFIRSAGGLGLAAFGAGVCLLSTLPITMNQFAVDRAGLTLALLLPLETRALLAGKAAGNALIACGPALVCMSIAFALSYPQSSLTMWLALPFAFVATYLLVAPVAAALSAMFPRAVDLNSIGRGSNAHGLAGLLGLLVFIGAALPAAGLILASNAAFHSPALTLAVTVVWCGLTAVISRILFFFAASLFDKRRENLGLTV